MLEMVVFAVTLVVAQMLAGFIAMKLMMSKYFAKKYYKWIKDFMNELEEMAFESDED